MTTTAELDHLGDLRYRHRHPVVLADERLRYLISHWYDVLVLALPLLRPLRLLRLIPLVVGAEPSGHDQTSRPGRNLCRRWRLPAGVKSCRSGFIYGPDVF
jgi:hypothetical protein